MARGTAAPGVDENGLVTDIVRRLRACLGDDALAVYAIGSLAHGGFCPDVSDIDIAIIVRDRCHTVEAAAGEVRKTVARAWSSPLAERLSVFWSSREAFANPGPGFRFSAVDRLDLLESGRLLAGRDLRGGLPWPSDQEVLRDTAAFACSLLDEDRSLALIADPPGLLAAGRRTATKVVLSPVRLLYTARTGRVGGNDEAVAWYAGAGGAASALAAAGLAWRTRADVPAVLPALLRSDLPALYTECLDGLSGHHHLAGHPDLRARLRRLRRSLAVRRSGPPTAGPCAGPSAAGQTPR